MENKTILVQRVPTDDKGNFLYDYETVERFHYNIKNALPENCILVTTPLEVTKVTGDMPLVFIDSKEYSYDKLMEIIENAWKYETLT